MTEMSTTRGMSFEPSAAAKDRAELARRADEKARETRRERNRAEARRLDEFASQVRRCYREHCPPQTRAA